MVKDYTISDFIGNRDKQLDHGQEVYMSYSVPRGKPHGARAEGYYSNLVKLVYAQIYITQKQSVIPIGSYDS